MLIQNKAVVTLHYSVRDDEGKLLETTEGRAPLAYIQGTNTLLPVLEKSLEGKKTGDRLKIRLGMESAFGPRREELISVVSRNQFESEGEIRVGQEFYFLDEGDNMISVSVIAVDGDKVVIDANHPFAGKDLNFDIEVIDVRPATALELEHGHVHGPGDEEL